jgi:hypothetical protein
MPPTATMEDIKAYLRRCEKGEVTSEDLPPCPRCNVESHYFKDHACRERTFLIVLDMVVQPIRAYLIRFRCPGCGKTFPFYPDFAIPYKRYTRQTITGFAERYVDSDDSYLKAVMDKDEKGVPGYAHGEKTLAPSTVHRWLTSLGRLVNTTQRALDLICQENPKTSICRDLAQWVVPRSKYRTQARKTSLFNCFRFLAAEALFKTVFHSSVFTKLAITCAFA